MCVVRYVRNLRIGKDNHLEPVQKSKLSLSTLNPTAPFLTFDGLPAVFHEGIFSCFIVEYRAVSVKSLSK